FQAEDGIRDDLVTGVQTCALPIFGALPDWVSAKDVILELLRRHGVRGGVGRIIEYYGPGLGGLSAMDRHVIANMGAELGATTTEIGRASCRERGEWAGAEG